MNNKLNFILIWIFILLTLPNVSYCQTAKEAFLALKKLEAKTQSRRDTTRLCCSLGGNQIYSRKIFRKQAGKKIS